MVGRSGSFKIDLVEICGIEFPVKTSWNMSEFERYGRVLQVCDIDSVNIDVDEHTTQRDVADFVFHKFVRETEQRVVDLIVEKGGRRLLQNEITPTLSTLLQRIEVPKGTTTLSAEDAQFARRYRAHIHRAINHVDEYSDRLRPLYGLPALDEAFHQRQIHFLHSVLDLIPVSKTEKTMVDATADIEIAHQRVEHLFRVHVERYIKTKVREGSSVTEIKDGLRWLAKDIKIIDEGFAAPYHGALNAALEALPRYTTDTPLFTPTATAVATPSSHVEPQKVTQLILEKAEPIPGGYEVPFRREGEDISYKLRIGTAQPVPEGYEVQIKKVPVLKDPTFLEEFAQWFHDGHVLELCHERERREYAEVRALRKVIQNASKPEPVVVREPLEKKIGRAMDYVSHAASQMQSTLVSFQGYVSRLSHTLSHSVGESLEYITTNFRRGAVTAAVSFAVGIGTLFGYASSAPEPPPVVAPSSVYSRAETAQHAAILMEPTSVAARTSATTYTEQVPHMQSTNTSQHVKQYAPRKTQQTKASSVVTSPEHIPVETTVVPTATTPLQPDYIAPSVVLVDAQTKADTPRYNFTTAAAPKPNLQISGLPQQLGTICQRYDMSRSNFTNLSYRAYCP